jgi:hypothetical protein
VLRDWMDRGTSFLHSTRSVGRSRHRYDLLSGVIPPAARSGTAYPFARKKSEAAAADQPGRKME